MTKDEMIVEELAWPITWVNACSWYTTPNGNVCPKRECAKAATGHSYISSSEEGIEWHNDERRGTPIEAPVQELVKCDVCGDALTKIRPNPYAITVVDLQSVTISYEMTPAVDNVFQDAYIVKACVAAGVDYHAADWDVRESLHQYPSFYVSYGNELVDLTWANIQEVKATLEAYRKWVISHNAGLTSSAASAKTNITKLVKALDKSFADAVNRACAGYDAAVVKARNAAASLGKRREFTISVEGDANNRGSFYVVVRDTAKDVVYSDFWGEHREECTVWFTGFDAETYEPTMDVYVSHDGKNPEHSFAAAIARARTACEEWIAQTGEYTDRSARIAAQALAEADIALTEEEA